MPTTGQLWPRGGDSSSGGGAVVEEVQVSTATPTDAAVELWMDTSGDVVPTASVVNSTAAVSAPAGTTSFLTTIPSGCQTGDVLYLALTCANTAAGSPLTITATGWTLLTTVADQGTTQRALYTAPWSAGLAGVTWAVGAAQRFGFVCVAIRNGRTAVVGSSDLGASGTALTCPGVTATGAGLALRLGVRKDNISTLITPGAGLTTLQSVLGAAAGPASHVAAFSEPIAAAGAVASNTITFNVASANGTAWTLAV